MVFPRGRIEGSYVVDPERHGDERGYCARADYILGAEPGPGGCVLGYNDQPVQQHYARIRQMGDGQLHTFYIPYPLPHLETPLSVARAHLFNDPTSAPQGGPVCEVVTLATRDLQIEETLDGIGGFLSYGSVDHASVVPRVNLRPMGRSEGAVLPRDIGTDEVIGYDDVEMPARGLADQLYRKPCERFATEDELAVA